MSTLPVRYSREATEVDRELLTRIRNKWGVRSIQKLGKQISACEEEISLRPRQHPRADYSVDVRKWVLTEQWNMLADGESLTLEW